ncbi:hypothetical protein AKJ39_04580 [candidate division MSBL1 archaeon SCGC-AAA259J03]|uniref:FMN hydroxy acid dehydrogenase domain-containing protein n=1 Tax=candidate division MSBL1 archaeon SCGC-AAA259J03 TaxID=1698269 RepID=A0A656YUS9_9EURY|nr:hypothetical protein AKJ39_04580 [candidate division MSBL1 archaeon SCGC-AAA259J03]
MNRYKGDGYGTETSRTVRFNREYFENLFLKMRVINSQNADTSANIFGQNVETPAMSGCMSNGWSGLLNIEEKAFEMIGKGLSEVGSIAWMGLGSKRQLSSLTQQCEKVVKISKPFVENERIINKIGQAEEMGAIAVGTDISFSYGGKIGDKVFRKEKMGPKTAKDLRDIISTVNLPFIVKGVLSKEDAIKARTAGADAIVVSNHAGVVLDYAAHPLQILPNISKEIKEDMTIIVDSGFRRGTDILKGLALGADGVLMGINTVIGLAANGYKGIRDLFEIVTDELKRAMSLTGCSKIRDINEEIVFQP